MNNLDTVQCIGYACGLSSGHPTACMGSFVLEHALSLQPTHFAYQWLDHLLPLDSTESTDDSTVIISQISERLAKYTCQLTEANQFFITVGGDHTSTLGTWSGVSVATNAPLGLIWININAYLNSIQTNSLACLLGHGPTNLTQLLSNTPKLLPEHTIIIGTMHDNSLQALKKWGVKIYDIEMIRARGLSTIIENSLDYITSHTVAFGLSINASPPHTQNPKKNNSKKTGNPDDQYAQCLNLNTLNTSLRQWSDHPHFKGIAITEFNPTLDINKTTEKQLIRLLDHAVPSTYHLKAPNCE